MSIRVTLYRTQFDILNQIMNGQFDPWNLFDGMPEDAYEWAAKNIDAAIVRGLILGKHWDEMLYVLSQEARLVGSPEISAWLLQYNDPLAWAVLGRQSMTTQYDLENPLRYCTHNDLKLVVKELATVRIEYLIEHLSEEKAVLERLGVSLATLKKDVYAVELKNMSMFYEEALQHREVVIYHLF